jgi:hypothetical protein
MPRDWMREDRGRDERRERGDDRPPPRDDFGQADFSRDYAYDPGERVGYRASEPARDDDYGQADYSRDYAYDERGARAYRRFSDDDRAGPVSSTPDAAYGRRMNEGEYRRGPQSREVRDYSDRDHPGRETADRDPSVGERGRSWADRAGAFFGGREEGHAQPARHRRGPSDRVLWAIIVERLEDQRGLDLRDVEVLVDNAEVTLNGTVRRKEDKRRIEDIADLDDVRHVQNNLRVRDSGRRWFG